VNWLSLFTTIFDIVYLIALLYVLWRFMRSSERNARANQDIAKTLIATSESNAQSARTAAQAAQDAVALLMKEHPHA